MREKKPKKGSDFEEFQNADIGKKKMLFVKWLMRKGVSLEKAKLICHRKFYHGDPFSE